jgi:hypothetical protein
VISEILLLSTEKVKTFMSQHLYAEQPVQQEDTPQPPPPNPREGPEEEKPVPVPAEQQKEDMSLRTFFDLHFGHSESLSVALIF